MARPLKASADTSVRGKALAAIALFALLAVFSLSMSIYDFTTNRLFFGIAFAVLCMVFVTLILLKLNTAFGTYIKLKDGTLYTKSWVNDFLPYNVNGGFFSDLKPSRMKLTEIPADEISLVLIGSKDFVKRNATTAGKRLVKALYPYERSAKKKELISSMDLFYVETTDGECSFMCVYGYNPKSVVNIIGELCSVNPDIYIKIGSSDYRRHVRKLQSKLNNDY